MTSLSLIEHLSIIRDPRIDRNKQHNLAEMLFVAVCAAISGAQGWSDIVDFGETKLEWLQRFIKLDNGIPVDDTFARVLSRVSPRALQASLQAWTQGVAEQTEGRIIAIDGKTARRSYDRKRQCPALHAVRAWATDAGFSLGQVATEAKSNEITAIPELLKLLELKGAIVTLDAMGCQRAIAEQIIDQGGDYVIAVKGNQSALYEAIRDFFATAQANDWRDVAVSYAEQTDAGHGRLEVRRCWASACLASLPAPERWRGLTSIALVESERHQGDSISIERRYFIASAAPEASVIARAVRAHWQIENGLHWVLDVTFREDESRIRRGHGAENFSTLRQFALGLLNREPSKLSIRKKRIRAGFSDDFRKQILDAAGC